MNTQKISHEIEKRSAELVCKLLEIKMNKCAVYHNMTSFIGVFSNGITVSVETKYDSVSKTYYHIIFGSRNSVSVTGSPCKITHNQNDYNIANQKVIDFLLKINEHCENIFNPSDAIILIREKENMTKNIFL